MGSKLTAPLTITTMLQRLDPAVWQVMSVRNGMLLRRTEHPCWTWRIGSVKRSLHMTIIGKGEFYRKQPKILGINHRKELVAALKGVIVNEQ